LKKQNTLAFKQVVRYHLSLMISSPCSIIITVTVTIIRPFPSLPSLLNSRILLSPTFRPLLSQVAASKQRHKRADRVEYSGSKSAI